VAQVAQVAVLAAQPFTPEAWSPFGWVPVPDTDRRDGIHGLAFAWGDAHLNYIHHRPEEMARTAEGPVVDKLYRHDSHTQALMPVNCAAVVAVAPALTDFSNPRHIDALRAFVLRPDEIVVLHKGTWHWGPFPMGREPVRLLNLQGRRYREDNTSVDLGAKHGVRVILRVR
jgi:ureidoglycolate hydrolase